mgnify:CR=1 FL=1
MSTCMAAGPRPGVARADEPAAGRAQRLGLPPALAVALPIVLLVLALTALHGRLSRRRPESCR